MAITIENTPGDGKTTQDTLWHVVSSNHSSIPDFKYVFDVWIDGVQKIRVKQYPEPNTTYGYFDAGAIVRNSMSYNWLDVSLTQQPTIFSKDYVIRYGEEYSGSTYLNLTSGSTRAFNWRPDLFRRKLENPIYDYAIKFFTERNRTFYADFTQSLFIATHQNGAIYINVYNENNILIDSYNVSQGDASTQFNLKVYFGYALDINAKYMTIETDSNGDFITIYNKCNPKYETIPIHFMNRFGVFETLHFDLVSRLTMDVERKGYERRDFNINGSNVDYLNNTTYAESKINYSNKMNWSYRLTADAMNDTDYQWASQLITSPQILMEVDDYFYPVTIKNTNYEYSKYVNNRQRALEVDFEMNQTRYSHLR
jgi:hypothetical protein